MEENMIMKGCHRVILPTCLFVAVWQTSLRYAMGIKMNIKKNNTTKNNTRKINTKDITLIGLMTAIMCILGPLSIPIPFSIVPITFTNLAIYFTAFILGWKKGTISCLIYLLIGFVGVPVFSGFSGGPSKLAGPTGGYLIGFIFLAILCGVFIEKFPGKRYMYVLGMVLGLAVTYTMGTAWLSNQQGLTFIEGLAVGVIPYLPGDGLKIVAAVIVGPILRRNIASNVYN